MNSLIIVDVQNDFLPGGALGVKNSLEILPTINQLLDADFDLIVASKDWHPPSHISFASSHGKNVGDTILHHGQKQTLWPEHCVQNTPGAEFHPNLHTDKVKKIIFKGSDKEIDSYSTFFDNAHLKDTGLNAFLLSKNVKNIYIAGLATDYCVKYSTLDALKLGFNTFVITDACRGVDLRPGDSQQALAEMQKAGAKLINSTEILKEIGRGGGI